MGHWYKPDGTPFYEVPNKSRGGMRGATIRDARKVNAYPSVTTILGCAYRPGLENWKIRQAIMSALTNPNIDHESMTEDEIMREIKRDSMESAKQAADQGTNIHDSIEAWFKGKPVPAEHIESVDAVVSLLKEKCGEQQWEAEKWFCSPDGYGGKIDLISPEWVIDFKTKEGEADNHKMYPEQLMQLAAYDQGTTQESLHPWRKKANIIVSRDIPGSVHWWEWVCVEDHHNEYEKFKHLLGFWHLSNNYFPHLEAAA